MKSLAQIDDPKMTARAQSIDGLSQAVGRLIDRQDATEEMAKRLAQLDLPDHDYSRRLSGPIGAEVAAQQEIIRRLCWLHASGTLQRCADMFRQTQPAPDF